MSVYTRIDSLTLSCLFCFYPPRLANCNERACSCRMSVYPWAKDRKFINYCGWYVSNAARKRSFLSTQKRSLPESYQEPAGCPRHNAPLHVCQETLRMPDPEAARAKRALQLRVHSAEQSNASGIGRPKEFSSIAFTLPTAGQPAWLGPIAQASVQALHARASPCLGYTHLPIQGAWHKKRAAKAHDLGKYLTCIGSMDLQGK